MAKYKSITAPSFLPVSVALTKKHLKVLHADEDDLIESYIKAARTEIEKKFRLALNKQVWELYMDNFKSLVILGSHNPILSVDSIKYKDADGVEQTIPTTDYTVDLVGVPAVIAITGSIPSIQPNQLNGIFIQFTCGYSNSDVEAAQQAAIPTDLVQAVLLRVAAFDQYREDKQMDKNKIKASDSLCSAYKPTLL